MQSQSWTRAKGYANGIAAQGTLVFVGGQIGWNAAQQFETDDFIAQTEQALRNVHAVLAAPDGRIWLGTGESGIDILDPDGTIITPSDIGFGGLFVQVTHAGAYQGYQQAGEIEPRNARTAECPVCQTAN